MFLGFKFCKIGIPELIKIFDSGEVRVVILGI